MRISKILRTTTLAFSLIAVTAGMSAAFADTNSAAAQQQASNSAPYDNADFVAPLSDTY